MSKQFPSKWEIRDAKRAERELRFDEEFRKKQEAEAEARVAVLERADVILHAIEAFVDAKIAYERRYRDDPEWASLTDTDETRDHLRDKIAEVLTRN